MSRSFHGTIRKYNEENNFKYSNDEIKEKNMNEIREDIFRKRITKKKTIADRKLKDVNEICSESFDPQSISIKIRDENEYIHFPASKEDILGVIKRLPYNVTVGLDSINLCLGKEYMEERAEDEFEESRDPFTNRISSDEEGLVFTPPALGTYFTETCKIFIYAYVYDKNELKLEIIEPYLRLQMLSTLVHEIAHHEDNILRSSRGKWLGFNDWKCEDYADFQQMNWSKGAVVPYLFDTYPEEYNALSNWIEKYGGVRFSLEKLAGECKGRRIGDKVKIVFSASSAVEDLFKNIINGMSERDAMLDFAKDLHYGDYYAECLEALDTMFKANPSDPEIMGIKADTYMHMEEYEKAEEWAEKCLSFDKRNIDALTVLCYLRSHHKDWKGLKDVSKLGINESDDDYHIRNFTEMHITALLYLKEYVEAEKHIELLPSSGFQLQRKLAFEALVKACSGNFNDAFEISCKILTKENIMGPARSMLKGIYNYIAAKQAREIKLYDLSEHEQTYLKNSDVGNLLEL